MTKIIFKSTIIKNDNKSSSTCYLKFNPDEVIVSNNINSENGSITIAYKSNYLKLNFDTARQIISDNNPNNVTEKIFSTILSLNDEDVVCIHKTSRLVTIFINDKLFIRANGETVLLKF